VKSTIDLPLGYAPEVFQLFSYANAGVPLTDVLSHGFNQTLQRDMYYGSWADAYIHQETGEYRLKISSPCNDVSPYEKLISGYLSAGRIALATYNKKGIQGHDFQFLLPFGLAMANVRSVQLFHFPPTETFSYSDYLYSPTNRRWECLLAQNGFDGKFNTLLERIVDVVPIAAAGGATEEIEPYNFEFLEYGKKLLENFLTVIGETTQPVVAYGSPVRDWLWKAYQEQIAAQLPAKSPREAGSPLPNPLHTLSVVTLEIIKGAKTPVLCANHPSMYLYDTDIPLKWAETKVDGKYPSPFDVMKADLIAAGWQAAMSDNWGRNPTEALEQMKKRWASEAEVLKLVEQHDVEFGFAR